MNVSANGSRRLSRTALAQGLMIALSLGCGAVEAGSPIASAVARIATHNDAPAVASLDELAQTWRIAQRDQAAPQPPPGSVAVSNCNDSGAGSLRDAISGAVSGDTIDLTAMGCSEITLTTGALVVTQNKLTLQGPTDGVGISANDASEVIVHVGNSYLTLDHLSIVHGSKYHSAVQATDVRGGCIASGGIVQLQSSEVTNCEASTLGATNIARGGAIFATGGVILSASLVGGAKAQSMIDSAGGAISSPGPVTLLGSIVTGGQAYAQSGVAHGGGIDAGGQFISKYTSVVQNVSVTATYSGSGGGAYLRGDVNIINSSFALNASVTGGGIEMQGSGSLRNISNSTIAGNSALGVAGVHAAGSAVSISNSSISYNRNLMGGIGSGLFAEGVNIDLQSTLIAWNGDLEAMVYADAEGSGTLTGSHNLIHTGDLAPPPGTIEHVDPQLMPTILNGTTVIIQVRPGSAAINAGSNVTGLSFDQRGTGFPREIGAATDIGSYEFDLGDLVFANSFD